MANLPKDEFQNLVSMNPDEYRETLRNKKGWSESSANQFEQLTRAKSPKELANQMSQQKIFKDTTNELEKKNAPRGFILGDDGFYAPREYTDEEMKSGYDLVLSHLQSGGHLDDDFFKNNPDVPSDVIYSAYGKFKEGK